MQGEKKGKNTIKEILDAIENLGIYEKIGDNIRERFHVECPDNWYLLYVNKNYFVFSKTEQTINVLKMYDYRQDFIHDLFGVEMRSKESKEYWGE